MNRLIHAIVLAAAAAALGACAIVPSLHSRLAYVEAHPYLSPQIARAIVHAEVVVGMTKDDVRAAWGDPCGLCVGTTHNSWGDSWDYNELGDAGEASATLIFFGPDGTVTGWSQP